MLVRFLEIKQPGVQNIASRYVRIIRLDYASIGVQAADSLARSLHLILAGIINLVQDDHIREFNLIRQQVHKGARILVPEGLAQVLKKIVA